MSRYCEWRGCRKEATDIGTYAGKQAAVCPAHKAALTVESMRVIFSAYGGDESKAVSFKPIEVLQ